MAGAFGTSGSGRNGTDSGREGDAPDGWSFFVRCAEGDEFKLGRGRNGRLLFNPLVSTYCAWPDPTGVPTMANGRGRLRGRPILSGDEPVWMGGGGGVFRATVGGDTAVNDRLGDSDDDRRVGV